MSQPIELSVSADLRKVLVELENLQKKAAGVGQQIQRVANDLDKNLARNTKTTEQNFERLRDLGRRLADQLRGYFSNMASQTAQSFERIKKDLGLKQQFIDATKGAVELHDTIRKIGGALDIAGGRMVAFQQSITAAFTKAGFGAEAASRALSGIASTQVSGEQNAQAYALTSAKLAQAGGQVGQEGEIARAITDVLRTQGIDQNNMNAMQAVANAARGRNPLEKLQAMNDTYLSVDPQLRGEYSPQTMQGLGAVRKEVGPEMDAFLKEMTKGWLQKLPATAQGLGNIVGPGGINFDEVKKHSGLLSRLGKDTAASSATLGLSEEAGRGLYALYKHADRAAAAQRRARELDGTLDQDVADRRTLGENFAANKNRVGGYIQNGISPLVDKGSKMLGKASQSDLGALGVLGGGFAVATAGAAGASYLAGKLGGKLGGVGAAASSIAKAGAVEQITGQKTIPVYVVNVAEFSGLNGGLGKTLADALKGGGAAGAGAAAGGGAMAAGLMAGVVGAVIAGGVATAGIEEKRAADSGQVLSRNDMFGGAKGGGSIGLLVDLFKQLLNKMDNNQARGAETMKRDKQVTAPSEERRGTPAATAARFGGGL